MFYKVQSSTYYVIESLESKELETSLDLNVNMKREKRRKLVSGLGIRKVLERYREGEGRRWKSGKIKG